jgi:hypothetical protein
MNYAGTGRNGNGKISKSDRSGKYGDLKLDRLVASMRRSSRQLEPFRRERRDMVKQFAGFHWNEQAADEEVPVNLLAKFVQIMARSLVPHDPRVMLRTHVTKNVPAVDAMEAWLNRHLRTTYFAEKFRRFVVDAFFSLATMKVALGNPADEAASYETPAGAPFCEIVDLDDILFDPTCASLERASWIAHKYRIPLDDAKELGFFDEQARSELQASDGGEYTEDGDRRLSTMGRGHAGGTEDGDYEEMVDLWEIWCRRSGKVITLPAAPSGGVPTLDHAPLKVADWLGPTCGPYHFLCFGIVPAQAMPKQPIPDLVALHDLINRLYVKLGQQAEREKEVLPVRGGQLDDADRLVETPDGHPFPCDNADNIAAVRYGGPSASNLQFTIHAKDLFNAQANNLELLSGSGPQSKTATQDKMLNENAGAGVQDSQETVVTCMSKVLSAYSWYLWYHPELVMKTVREAPGVPDVQIERAVYPAGYGSRAGSGLNRRDGDFESLDIRVDPYSLQHKSPQQRMAFIDQTVKDLLPTMPMLAQQGVNFDAQAYLKIKAKYGDEPDLLKVFTVGEPIAPPGGADGQRMPSETSREYVRRSVGQDTQANREATLSNSMSEEAASVSGEQ